MKSSKDNLWDLYSSLASIYWGSIQKPEIVIPVSKELAEEGFKYLVWLFKYHPVYLACQLYKAFLQAEQEKYIEGNKQ